MLADRFAAVRRLHDRGPTCRGLAVDAEGIALGADRILADRIVASKGVRSRQAAGRKSPLERRRHTPVIDDPTRFWNYIHDSG